MALQLSACSGHHPGCQEVSQVGDSSAPGSLIVSVGQSHKGTSVTIQLRGAIPGWLAPLPRRATALPLRHKGVRTLEQGGPREAVAGLSWELRPDTGKQRVLLRSQCGRAVIRRPPRTCQHDGVPATDGPCAEHFVAFNWSQEPREQGQWGNRVPAKCGSQFTQPKHRAAKV